jgi:hypothetical protein
MAKDIRIPLVLWDRMMQIRDNKLKQGDLKKPIVFALYSGEKNHFEVNEFKEIEAVTLSGRYPDGQYTYEYPGVKSKALAPPDGSGKCLSGTLVIGDGLDIGDRDEKRMIRGNQFFRIKMDRDPGGEWESSACYIQFAEASLAFE